MSSHPVIVGANIDTWLLNIILTDFSEPLVEELDALKHMAQEAEDDEPTRWTFCGETLYIKPHGSQRQWRWILHCPSLHLDVGTGKHNHIAGKARLSSAFLWEHGPDVALANLYAFVVSFFGAQGLRLQVSEVHLCADVAGWELSLGDAPAFITRGHKRRTHVEEPEQDEDAPGAPGFEMNLEGRRCTGYEFSKGAAHSCCIYDKTKEITKSRKDWMRAVWERHGWDGESRITRVEFRYKRECLHEMEIEDPYDLLDKLPALWAYSSAQWLRHTTPTPDTNRGRWESSPFWLAIQQADFYGEAEPAVRERKRQGDVRLLCQMIAGCASSAAAYLANELPETDSGAEFLTWFHDWMGAYLNEKGLTFQDIRDGKWLRLGVVVGAAA